MSSHYKTFRDLHYAQDLLVLPNIWDAKSATIIEESGFPAIATSSAAVAQSLGYEDGEGMPFADYLFVIGRIVSSVKVPVSVDLEMGYGKTSAEIFTNISRLAKLGVAGINLEDSLISSSGRALQSAESFAERIAFLKKQLLASGIDFFINVRCDTYILNVADKQNETTKRAKLYESSGADGIFLPFMSNVDDIKATAAATQLPINVMSMQGLPDFETLKLAGVSRLSMGPFLFEKIYSNVKQISTQVLAQKADAILFS